MAKTNEIIDLNKMLTVREIQVLQHISNGFEDKEIAHIMDISVHTVRAFVHKIIQKLSAKNRVHAACSALRLRLIK